MDASTLLQTLRAAVSTEIGTERTVALAYSGGLDSSFLEKLASDTAEVVCYTVGVEGSVDIGLARERALRHPSETIISVLDDSQVMQHVMEVGNLLGSDDPTKIAYTIPLYRVIEIAEEKLVLAGSGADELFAGYAKYERSKDLESDTRDDLRKMFDEAAKLRILAEESGKRLVLPFVSASMVELSSRTPAREKIGPEGRKLILRAAAKEAGVSGFDRPKKAAQHSSGVMKAINRLARDDHKSVTEWTRDLLAAGKPRP